MSDTHHSYLKIKEGTVIQRFDLAITAAGQLHSDTFEIQAGTSKVLGILMTSDREDLMFYRGAQEIKVNSQEFMPEGYESKLLMSGLNVPPHERYHTAEFAVGSRKVEMRYRDSEHTKAPFEPYRVSLYVFSE
jgi:hypothetical protein